ncbi:hypothetical protein O6H91_17G069000 [Diphasiastrum complanatum]|uniref:Uncharacterized protein n=1 Tax=Diphasiastrum complanatum TaxID=34168 RepID=A0ACC2B7S2_DIPCM|nr:hypothetical protein O6H91_Y224300 [Diphasiastrum complanatum]KAJ7525831.1 hypothetical protein O6H91_17G069000 [Diphasiastrum complanatum]
MKMHTAEALRIGKAILLNRWMVLVASFFVMIGAGGVYNFGIYSQSIKLSLGYNQETINTLSFFKDIGTNVGVIGGILYDWTGPPLVFGTGAVFNVVGYLMIWLAVTGRIARPEVWHMCFYFVIASSWTAFINTACIVTCIKNFPLSRGIVMGLLKGSLGLGGAILTLLYRAIYGDNPESFILLLAWFPTVICLLLMFIIRIVNVKQLKTDMKKFYVFLVMILSMAAYLMIIIIIQDLSKVSKSVNQILCAIMFVLLITPLCVVVRDEIYNQKAVEAASDPEAFGGMALHQIAKTNSTRETKDLEASGSSHPVSTSTVKDENHVADSNGVDADLKQDHSSTVFPHQDRDIDAKGLHQQRDSENIQSTSKLSNVPAFGGNTGKLVKFIKESQRATELKPAQAIFNLNLWVMFISSTCGIGSQLMAIDNLGQIGAALGYSQTNITTCVSLVSIWNCLGRVGSGFISEFFLQSRGVPRPLFLMVVLAVSALGHLLLAFNPPAALYLGSIIIGLCYGAQFTLIFTIISEICGLRYYATIFNIVQLSSPLGLYVLSVRTAGMLYDREARKQLSMLHLGHLVQRLMAPATAPAAKSSILICTGSQCYKTTFFIMTAASFVGAVFAGILAIRTRWLYKRLHTLHIYQNELKLESDKTSKEDIQTK